MSAYVVSKAHIDALVRCALGDRDFCWEGRGLADAGSLSDGTRVRLLNGYKKLAEEDPSEVGDMLVRECVRSVSWRYQDNEPLPGPIDTYYFEPYHFNRNARALTPVEGLKALACYEYQSCEHEEWADSEAKSFCDSLRDSLINRLPGYDEATWEVEA